ncbi:MAG: AmmeMemoRadiSam system protein A [Candidatus Micrarchaeota archaeon]
MALDKKEKYFLLKLARSSIRHYLKTGGFLELKPTDVPSKRLVEDGACFVSLHMKGELRGCIGTLEAHRPLFRDVLENAVASATEDPRFSQLSLGELEAVEISISVLSKPEPFLVKDAADLLKKLVPDKHGLIIQKGYARATFLPIVWEQLPKKEEFLAHLCMKAGLDADEWRQTKTMSFFTYEAEEFSE